MIIRVVNGLLYANQNYIVDLTKPFKRIHVEESNRQRKAIGQYESCVSKNQNRNLNNRGTVPYVLKVTKEKYYSLIGTRRSKISSYTMYQTRQEGPGMFMASAIQHVLDNLDSKNEHIGTFIKYINASLRYLLNSSTFDKILVDFDYEHLIDSCMHNRTYKISPEIVKDTKDDAVNSILRHHKRIPLKILDPRLLEAVPHKTVDFSSVPFEKGDRVLVLSFLNPFFAKYISSYLVSKGCQSLATSIIYARYGTTI